MAAQKRIGPLKNIQSRPRPESRTTHYGLFERHLTYTPHFKQLVRRHPGLIRGFMEARKTMLQKPTVGELKIKRIAANQALTVERIHRVGNVYAFIYKVHFAGKTFFIKEQLNGMNPIRFSTRYDLAEPQIGRLQEAQPIIKKWVQKNKKWLNGIKIEVANYHLAWTDKNNSFLVLDFYKGENLHEVGDRNRQEHARLMEIQKKLGDYLELQGFGDVEDGRNTIWDSKNQKLILFDLR